MPVLRVEEVLAGPDSHHNFFQRGIAGPLADAVDGAFHLPGAPDHGFQAIGHRQTQIVMAMHADYRFMDIGHILENAFNPLPPLLGNGIAHRIRNIDRSGSGLDYASRI